MTPAPDLLESVVRSLRAQPLRIEALPSLLRKQAPASEVRFVPGSATASYILPGMGLAVVVQPAVAESRVLQLLEQVAQRPDTQALLLVDSRWRLGFKLPLAIEGKPLRLQLVGSRG